MGNEGLNGSRHVSKFIFTNQFPVNKICPEFNGACINLVISCQGKIVNLEVFTEPVKIEVKKFDVSIHIIHVVPGKIGCH